MVAVLMPSFFPSWLMVVTTLLALGAPVLLVLFAETAPSFRRVLGACLVALVVLGGCVVFAEEAVRLDLCAVYEAEGKKWSAEWWAAGCWWPGA